jgi:hypothetical protein
MKVGSTAQTIEGRRTEGICGVFQSSLLAPWASFCTAATALIIYGLSRKNAKADLEARRKVLYAMLRQHLLAIAESGDILIQMVLDGVPDERDPEGWKSIIDILDIDAMDRITELQTELIAFGKGDDAKIAAFIKVCRTHQRCIEKLRKIFKSKNHDIRRLRVAAAEAKAAFAAFANGARETKPYLENL